MTPQELGERIRQAREALGLSQDDLATRVNRDQRSVSEYENGKRRIYAHDLPTFAQALQVPIGYFFQEVVSSDDVDVMLLEALHQFQEEDRKTLLNMIRLLSPLINR